MPELLPLACWPLDGLLELRESIAEALAGDRVHGHDLVIAWDWARRVDDELAARASFDLEAEIDTATPGEPQVKAL